MNRFLIALSAILLWAPASKAQEGARSIDEAINQAISPVTDVIVGVIF